MTTRAPSGRVLRQGGLSLLLLLLLVPAPALAGPPYITDDPEPVGYQQWELYLASFATRARGTWTGTGPHVEANYGVLPNVELHLLTPFVFVLPAEGSGRYGYGDTELGIKFRFIQETEWSPQVAVAPLLELPSGDSRNGLGSGQVQGFLPLWLQKSFGSWTTYGGGGYWINPGTGNKDYWLFGWQIERQILDWVATGIEVVHTTPATRRGDAETRFNIGLVINLTERQDLLFSAGRGIQGPTDFQGYLAYRLTFGPRK